MLSVNPSELEVEANVRKDVQLTPEFIKSVKTHGVLVPIIVVPGIEGYRVIDGQRRALAAVEAGLKNVPVIVVDPVGDEKDRIVTQLVVNDNREPVNMADTVAAVKELALFGMSPTAIAKNLGAKKPAIDAALRVGESDAATDALTMGLTLDAALVISEFDDWPEAQADILAHADDEWSLDHTAAHWRDERGLAQVALMITGSGVELVDPPGWDEAELLGANVLYHDEALTEPVTDEEMQSYAGDGLCAFPTSGWNDGKRIYEARYLLRGWKEKGLHTHPYIESRGAKAKELTPEEQEAAKVERRRVRENNKAWKTATVVRIEFLAKILRRRSMPKGWDVFVAGKVLTMTGYSAYEWDLMAMLLGVEDVNKSDYRGRQVAIQKFLADDPRKAQAVMLASALAMVEGAPEFGSKGWRHGEHTVRYLSMLREWGYGLSEIEQEVVG